MRNALTLSLLLVTGAASAAAPSVEQRMAIKLTPDEAAAVRNEMRTNTSGVQQIVAGLADNDMKAVAAAARSLGMTAMRGVPQSTRAKLPMQFREIGHANHMLFDDLARDAESLGDTGQALKQLAQGLQGCVSCHAVFRIEEVKADKKARK